jgi:hypothetical protein
MSSLISNLIRNGGAAVSTNASVRAALLAMLTPQQRAFVQDPARFKLARCSRRAGKTYGIAAYLIMTCLTGSNIPVLYAGLTRDSAKKAIWDILLTMLDRLQIAHTARPSQLMIELHNGSTITLFGCDAENARNRLRGRKFKLACFDETGFYAALDPIVYAILPTLADYRGTLCLTSSPGEVLAGLFYEADCGKDKERWSRHSWTLYDNPHFQQPSEDPAFASRADEELDTICRLQFGGNRSHTAFRREYLGEWVNDHTALVYGGGSNNWIAVPFGMREQQHAVGINLTSNVLASVVVGRYSEWSREFQFIESSIYGDVELDALAESVRMTIEHYNPTVVMAALPKGSDDVLRELRRRYKLPILPTHADSKSFHQRVVRSDLRAGYIKVVRDLPLQAEFVKIVKDKDGEEVEGQQNWASDAALAVYRHVYQTHLQTYEAPLTEEERHIAQLEATQTEEQLEWWER